MNILIRNKSNQPIYEQIYNQIKAQILGNEIEEGSALPSMRQLALDLRISVITTKRAYEDLERDGFIVAIPGKGSFVAEKNLELLRETYLKEIEALMLAILEKASLSDISQEELSEMMNLLAKEN